MWQQSVQNLNLLVDYSVSKVCCCFFFFFVLVYIIVNRNFLDSELLIGLLKALPPAIIQQVSMLAFANYHYTAEINGNSFCGIWS